MRTGKADSFMFQTLARARREPVVPLRDDDFDKTARYWRYEFAQLDPKTEEISRSRYPPRSTASIAGVLFHAFCTETTLVPELTFHGAIIIMDMSALTWNEDGIIAQQLFKFMWQRAVLARNKLPRKHADRPVFLWADEAQYFVNSFDSDFQSTCRSAKGLHGVSVAIAADLLCENGRRERQAIARTCFSRISRPRCFTTTPTRKRTAGRPIRSGVSCSGAAPIAKASPYGPVHGDAAGRKTRVGAATQATADRATATATIRRIPSGGSNRGGGGELGAATGAATQAKAPAAATPRRWTTRSSRARSRKC